MAPTPVSRPSDAEPRPLVRWVAVWVVPLALVLVLSLLAECAVRGRQWIKYGTPWSLERLYRFDERMDLRVLVPGTEVGAIRINSAGFRGPDIPLPKPEQVVRIAFLGASTTFCAEVSADGAAWPPQVVAKFAERFPGVRFDFVNGGVPGYVVSSSRRNLRHKVAPLQPDVVVVYHATNDLSGEINAQAAKAGLPVAEKRSEAGWLQRHSLLWELAVKNWRVLMAQRQRAGDAGSYLQFEPARLGVEFGQQLGELLRESAATGARVAVATFSTQLRPGQGAEQQRRAAVSALIYMPSMSIDGLLAGYARYNEVIGEVAQRNGALLIRDENRVPGDGAHFVDSVHFSDRGAQVMAQRIFDGLVADPQVLAIIERAQRR